MELTKREQFILDHGQESAWDHDVYGVRPRHPITVEQAMIECDNLSQEINEELERDKCKKVTDNKCPYTGKECFGYDCKFEYSKEEAEMEDSYRESL